jgi:flagellin
VQINTTTTTTHLAGFGPANVASANAIGTVDIDFTGDLSATPYNGASITSIDPASTARLAPSLILSDVTYDTTSPSSINAAVDAINAATGSTNITASVGADGSNNAGKIVLAHNTDAAAGIGEHGSLSSVYTAYDTANSDPAATIEVIGQEGVISFHENAGTAFNLVLALDNSTGAAGANSSFTIDTTADLQTAVDAINGTAGTGTAEHGYTASIVATPDGSSINGKIKLTSGSAGSGFTQVSINSLDLGRVGHSAQTVNSSDGSFDADTGVFTPGNTNTTGTVSLTLGDTAVTVSGISDKGASPASDAAAIAAEINAGSHGYKAEVLTGINAGKVKITAPTYAQNMDVTDDDKARVSIVAIDAAIQTVNIQRSKLGAVSNRLSHTINNLTNISSNLSAAQGGIEDADFAHETTMLAKNQILQQASTAMLAQANASKQNVLSLLQG